MGALGDIAAPLMFALFLRLHAGFRSVFAACGVACLAQALWLRHAARAAHAGNIPVARSALEQDDAAHGDHDVVARAECHGTLGDPLEAPTRPPLMAAMRAALADPALLGWVLATMLCALLDEILLVFSSLHLHERRHFDAATTDVLLLMLAIGSMVGIAITDRLVTRASPRIVLSVSCLMCVAVYLVWLAQTGVLANGVCLFALGAAIGPQFPLAQAQCYRRARAEPVLVNVIESALEPLHAALPFLLGLLADRAGLAIALLMLLLQPLAILAALILSGSRSE
jgi:predicted MFS family arabinose efflux permease